jgi:hypothetical protein
MWQCPILLEDSRRWLLGHRTNLMHVKLKMSSHRLYQKKKQKKNGPINFSCIKPAQTFTFSLPLANSHVTLWILNAPNPAAVPVYNSTDMESRLIRRNSGDVSILSSISTAKIVCATWSLGFHAWIILILCALKQSILSTTSCTAECGICNCRLTSQTDLHGLCRNASLMQLTISSEVPYLSRWFYIKQPTCSLKFAVPEPNAFLHRKLTSILHSKMMLNSHKRLQLLATTCTEPLPVVSTSLLSSPKITSWGMGISWAWKNNFY